LWITNAPTSSYPACFAVKTAELQGIHAGETYLRLVREAVMVKGRDISKAVILIDVAGEMSESYPHLFSLEQFLEDFYAKRALPVFQDDLSRARLHNITRYPTLIFKGADKKGVVVTGYRPYDALVRAIQPFLEGIAPRKASAEAYKDYWKSGLTGREMKEIMDGQQDEPAC